MTTYPLIHRSPVGYLSTFDVPSILENDSLEYYFGGWGNNLNKKIFRTQKRAIRSII
jgi:hypothetical protein